MGEEAISYGPPSRRRSHGHVAMLIAQGEHPKLIADRLGHASPNVTMSVYAHLFPGLDVEAADRLDAARAKATTDPPRTPAAIAIAE